MFSSALIVLFSILSLTLSFALNFNTWSDNLFASLGSFLVLFDTLSPKKLILIFSLAVVFINLSLENGHNVLLIDQRAHGDSEGHTISFGILERFDILSWINYLNSRFTDKIQISLIGISMGGATVLMASELDLPSNVKLVIADCPFSSATDIITKVTIENNYPIRLLKIFLPVSAKLLGGFDLNASSAKEAVKNAKVPILLIHGDEDDFVPYYMSETIKANNPDIEFHTFKCNIHGLSYIFDTPKYKQIVTDFMNKHLN